MNQTKIEWADATWNPVTGCTPVSEGCEHCYAARMAKRLAGRFGYPKDDPFRVTFHPDRLEEPLHWRKPKKIFVCSMGDLFHEDVPNKWIVAVWSMMAIAPQHTYLILTKRPERMKEFLSTVDAATPGGELDFALWDRWREHNGMHDHEQPLHPLSNVWLGVTAENQATADERIPVLLDMPAAMRFVSVEPILKPVNLRGGSYGPDWLEGWDVQAVPTGNPNGEVDAEQYQTHVLDWVICGAETGPKARPMDYAWGRDLHAQCCSAGVPFFFKKGNGGEEPPPDLFVREWPLCSQGKRS